MARKEWILHGRTVVAGYAEGEALVSPVPLMGWGSLKHEQGVIVERNHPLYGENIRQRVLVFPEPRGSGGFNTFGRTRQFGVQPAAFLFQKCIALTVLAAMEMCSPAMTDFDLDPVAVIRTGDFVIVDADRGTVIVQRPE